MKEKRKKRKNITEEQRRQTAREASRRHRIKNREARRLENQEYRRKNKEAINARGRDRYHKDRASQLIRSKKYRDSHKAEARKYYEENRERILAGVKKYREENIESIKAYAQDNKQKFKLKRQERYKNDIHYRLASVCRIRVTMLVDRSARKETWGEKENYFGADQKTVEEHISSLFTPEMSWENWGTYWQLDHIIPLRVGEGNASLLQKLLHYKNTRPLSIKENKKKSGKIIMDIFPSDAPFTKEEILEAILQIDKIKAEKRKEKQSQAINPSL